MALTDTKYSEIFDFNFLTSHCCKTVFDSQQQIIKEQLTMNKKLETELENQRQINLDLQRQINEIKQEMSNLHHKIHYPYIEPSRGILSSIPNQFELTAGGETPSDGPVRNILDYDKSTRFYNYMQNNARKEENKGDCYIKFDFVSAKVIIESYFIRSNYSNPDLYHHPKTFKLLGSNDDINYDVIDKRENEESLNGPYKENRFICNQNNQKAYRYIKYLQAECWCKQEVAGSCYNLYNIYITYFQLYGDVVY